MEIDEEWHTCHFCGTYVNKAGYSNNNDERHFISDCRPDLVEHEIGDDCTWAFMRNPAHNTMKDGSTVPQEQTCYAYQNKDLKWTTEHIHFYPDGPM